jgi:hypothetical protein
MAKAWQDENATNCVGADAALSPLHLPAPAPARAKAGFSPIPFRHWHGRLEKLPVELQQIFLPLLPPHWERLRQGEIAKTQVFVPKVGVLTLQLQDDEVWATFVDALQWAYQLLQHLRRYVLALRYRTIVRNEHGGTWVWLPQQIVFPPDFRPTLFCCVECQTSLLERSPPLWKQNDHLRRKTDEAPCPQISHRWLDAVKPRAKRAPSFRAALWRCVGGSRFHAA